MMRDIHPFILLCGVSSLLAACSAWSARAEVKLPVIFGDHMMLQRDLLYTALTRARKRAVIVWSSGLANKQTGQIYRTALQVAVANNRIARRYSGLAERLERAIGEVARLSAG